MHLSSAEKLLISSESVRQAAYLVLSESISNLRCMIFQTVDRFWYSPGRIVST